MVMMKRIMSRCIVVILALAMIMPAAIEANDNSTTESMETGIYKQFYEASYHQYLMDHMYDGRMASSEVSVDLNSFETSAEMEADLEDGLVITGERGKITWSVHVQEAGFYNIEVSYYPVKGTNSKIERRLLIDDQTFFKGMNQLTFNRIWDNSDGQSITHRNGNEVRPVAVEKPELITVYISDAQRRSLEPYNFYLSTGTHTLTFESVKEPIAIRDITLKAAPEIKPYSEVIEEWMQTYKIYDGENIVYQAERTDDATIGIDKSSMDIIMSTDYSNPNTVPYHPYKIKLNTIGGANWRTPGDFIRWHIVVPEEGLYSLAFRGEQNTNRGVMSYRQLKVNGEVPYREAMAIPFAFNSGFVNYRLGDEEDDFLVYLQKGKNTLSLEVVLGEFAMPLSEVEESVFVLNDLYRKTVQITGLVPDKYIDYEIIDKIPNYVETFKAESGRLRDVVDELVRITGEKGEKTAIIDKMQVQAEGLSKDPENVVNELTTLANNISSLGTWITSISEMPLLLDSFTLSAPGAELVRAKPNFFVRTYYGVVRFLSTFFIDETKLLGDESEDAIKVWVTAGRDQAQIIKELIEQDFTPLTNIPVDLQLIPEDVILPATLAGNGPDVALTIPQATVVNFAIRNAVVDLSTLDGFEEQRAKFNESALSTVTFQDGIYGLPEQQSFMMMFYRHDILTQLGLDPPTTWDDVEHVISVLHANNYDFYIPGQALFPSLVYQYGGDLYKGSGNDYGIESGLTEESAMDAFSRTTRFFTSYRLPVSADFSNRFRTGEMPVGVEPYTTYNQLEVFAPEIRGLWSFAPLPGLETDDGSVNNTAVSNTINSIILSASPNIDESWEFLKWWLDTEVQTQYANALEAIMGTAARYPTANIDVLKQLPWSLQDAQQLIDQFATTVGIPEVPGGYMSERAIDYAFRSVVTSGANPREALYLNTKQIDRELTKKRKEFHLSHLSND